uniref:Ubiquitin carboxyl-terminal hydrolase n=1 Tax=Globodera rostochiensis TaxID=31243 RepID=A0A914H6N1_GLORO
MCSITKEGAQIKLSNTSASAKMPRVKIKWGTEELSVNANLEETPLLFKAQLFELTNIPPERQKLIVRGKTISDESWNGIKIQDGSVIMLIGSAGSMLVKSENVESSSLASSAEKARHKPLPVGLRNLGNTCYMNSSLQCLKIIPEFEAALKQFNAGQSAERADGSQRIKLFTNSLEELYNEMNNLAKEQTNSYPEIVPMLLVHVFRQTFPQFDTQDGRGQHQQQDANECFCEMLRMISDETVSMLEKNDDKCAQRPGVPSARAQKVPLKQFFEIEHEVVVKCLEEGSNDEPQRHKEKVLQLSCFLDQEVRYIQAGIRNKMVEEIEKKSKSLDRNAKFEKRSMVSRLPAYLSVQMVRFFYKEEKNISAKILKDVKFPIVLDVFDFCNSELQDKLKPARAALKEYDDAKIELMRKAKLSEGAEAKPDLTPSGFHPNSFSDDIGSNNSGFYELKCLITHQGRSSSSGHYVAWVRIGDEDEKSDTAKWVVCDDSNISPVSEEEILKLSGGGDWHCAYVLIYGPKKIPRLDSPEEK